MKLAIDALFIGLIVLNIFVYYKMYRSYGKMMYSKGKLHGFKEYDKQITKALEKHKANSIKKQHARSETETKS